MKLYHGTTDSNLDTILKDGLRPRGKKKSTWEQFPSRTDMVYLTAAYAAYFALNSDKGRPLILEIDTDFLDQDKFYPDEDFITQALQRRDEFKNEDMAVIHKKVRKNLLTYKDNWQNSVEYIGNCCYRGVISPAAITRYCSWDLNDDNLYLNMLAMDPSISIMNYKFMKDKYTGLIAWLFGDIPILPMTMPDAFREQDIFKQQFERNEEMSRKRDYIQVVDLCKRLTA